MDFHIVPLFYLIILFQLGSISPLKTLDKLNGRELINDSVGPAAMDDTLDSTSIFIMGSTGHMQHAPWHNWYTRIVPSFNTWASAFKNVFIVMPNNEFTYEFLNEHHCSNRTDLFEYRCPEWGGVDKKGPVVLLTEVWNCNDNYHGDGPCCKANFALW